MVEFVYQGILHNRPKIEKTAEIAASATFSFGGYEDFDIAVLFTSRSGIKRLNSEYRNLKKVTDVLSFPSTDDFTGDEGFFGDLALSLAVARKQAKRYDQSLSREIAFLVIHGCLHLLGYDHETKADEMKMRSAQREILEMLKEKLD
ncbi:MAG: rRNA maturation RNase YbeY [Eubacteriales bacterium]